MSSASASASATLASSSLRRFLPSLSSVPIIALAYLATYLYQRFQHSSPTPPTSDISSLEHPGVHHTHQTRKQRFWTNRLTGASPGAAQPAGVCPRSHIFHLILVRHAESSNNVIAEQMSRDPRWGPSPYAPGSPEAQEYDRRRSSDPPLSELGELQAAALPDHPYLNDLHLPSIALAHRVLLASSPMHRAILTSIPLYHHLNTHHTLPLIPALPFMCERGGCYRTDSTGNHHDSGATRATLQATYGDTHDFSACPEDGWWSQCTSKGDEDDNYFQQRLQQALGWIVARAREHYIQFIYEYTERVINATSTSTSTSSSTSSSTPPDMVVLISHADFINSLVSTLLRIPEESRYVFYSSNTSVHHLEIDLSLYSPEELLKLGDFFTEHMEVRVRVANARPTRVKIQEEHVAKK